MNLPGFKTCDVTNPAADKPFPATNAFSSMGTKGLIVS